MKFQNIEGATSGGAADLAGADPGAGAEPTNGSAVPPGVALRPVPKRATTLPPKNVPLGRAKEKSPAAAPGEPAKADAAAAPEGAPASGEPAEPEKKPAESVDAIEGAKRFAALSRKTAVLERREAAFKTKEAEFAKREAEFSEKSKGLATVADLVKLAKDDQVAFVERLAAEGVDPKAFLMALAKPVDPVQKLQKQVDAAEQKRQADEKAAKEKAEADRKADLERQIKENEAKEEAALVQIRADAAAEIASNAEEYELLVLHEEVDAESGEKITGPDLVRGLIHANFKQCKAEYQEALKNGASQADLQKIRERSMLSTKEAAKLAEEYLLERARAEQARLSKSKKLSAAAPKSADAVPAAAKSGTAPPKPSAGPARGSSSARGLGRTPTLAGEPAAATVPELDPDRPMTRAEIKADIARRREKILRDFNAAKLREQAGE